jgi:hypothetical protein
MTLALHVSPEAGWRQLSKFFDGDDYDRITIDMYNFTAPHIIEAIQNAIEPHNRQMILTLDRKSNDIGGETKKDDWPEEKAMKTLKQDAGKRFRWTPASVSGPGKLFATSYHIKVAVLSGRSGGAREGGLADKRFWLSSGNWASSNQAPLDDQTITPRLSCRLSSGVTESVLFINQSFDVDETQIPEHYKCLLDACWTGRRRFPTSESSFAVGLESSVTLFATRSNSGSTRSELRSLVPATPKGSSSTGNAFF